MIRPQVRWEPRDTSNDIKMQLHNQGYLHTIMDFFLFSAPLSQCFALFHSADSRT